jgi:hypothetical protein
VGLDRVLLKAWGYEHSGGTLSDHIYLPVADLKRSDTFYGAMLGPLGTSEHWAIPILRALASRVFRVSG